MKSQRIEIEIISKSDPADHRAYIVNNPLLNIIELWKFEDH